MSKTTEAYIVCVQAAISYTGGCNCRHFAVHQLVTLKYSLAGIVTKKGPCTGAFV